jgi:hypothetical protein
MVTARILIEVRFGDNFFLSSNTYKNNLLIMQQPTTATTVTSEKTPSLFGGGRGISLLRSPNTSKKIKQSKEQIMKEEARDRIQQVMEGAAGAALRAGCDAKSSSSWPFGCGCGVFPLSSWNHLAIIIPQQQSAVERYKFRIPGQRVGASLFFNHRILTLASSDGPTS